MKNFLSKIKLKKVKELPYGGYAIILLVILIAIINYKPGTILTGWDNLHPEFALDVNIKRSIFAVWQEYQGLGLLGGMGHASDLVRQLLLIPLTAIFPMESVRYISTFIALLLGSFGAYFLVKKSLLPYHKNKEILATAGGIFYLLNIGTIQTFYVAFEAFTSHYAALPWLLYGALLYIKNSSKRNLLIFSIIVLLATPSGYIPTLFVAFLLSLSLLSFSLFAFTKNKRQTIYKIIKTYGIIFAVSAFWLLPFLYFTLTSSSVNLNAKMNQMATDTIFLQNKEYGSLLDVAMLKGFWFSNVDPDLSGNFRYMLSPYINHLKNPWITTASLASFGIILAGIFATLKNRRPLHLSFLVVFIFSFIMLATSTPGLEIIVDAFRKIPLFGQAFRFPFTKFSILASLMYSVFFVFGIESIANLLRRILKKYSVAIIALIGTIFIVSTAIPVFNGQLFYEKETIKLPNEYLQTFEFFKNQDQDTRIANFPQHTFWGWNFYNWGYGGSGFLWYGIKQPILDRAFDVWSDELENYYHEASNALYSKDSRKFYQVLNKYKVNWIILDRNIYSPFSQKSTILSESEELFASIPQIKKEKEFGGIIIYKVKLAQKSKKYISVLPNLPKVNSYNWNNNDVFFLNQGNYISSSSEQNYYYPFRSLFSYHSLKDQEFDVQIEDEKIIFRSLIPPAKINRILKVPSINETENIIPVEFVKELKDGSAVFSIKIRQPEINLNNESLEATSSPIPLFIMPQEQNYGYVLNNNGHTSYISYPGQEFKYKTFLSLTQDNVITLKNTETGEILTNIISADYLKNSFSQYKEITITPANKPIQLQVVYPKIIDKFFGFEFNAKNIPQPKDCNNFRKGIIKSQIINENKSLNLLSQNDTSCSSILAEKLMHNNSYLVRINAKHTSGKTLHFWIQNLDQQYAPLDTFLEKKTDVSNIILSPMEQYGQGYSFHFENISIGNTPTDNTINSIQIMTIPYEFLAQINIQQRFNDQKTSYEFKVSHPNESIYSVYGLKTKSSATLLLSQSYDPGWKAYTMKTSKNQIVNYFNAALPFLFGKEINTHVKVNNWENGWEVKSIDPSNSIAIVYLPQYLQYLGFFMLLIPLFYILIPLVKLILKPIKKLDIYFDRKSETLKHYIQVRLHVSSV